MIAARAIGRSLDVRRRLASTASSAKDKYKVVVVGAGMLHPCLSRSFHVSICTGSGGLSVAQQIYNRFANAKKSLNTDDIAILDAAEYHHYQVHLNPRVSKIRVLQDI
jgi:hypothetical protein